MKTNAIIMAAGLSSRFVPLSLETPKALIKVRGEILIERQIKQLKEAGIEEIVIVVGYLKEQLYYLREKYGVIIIENPYYQTRNNHSSLYVAKEYLGNTYICSGDNYFHKNVFLEKLSRATYASVYEEGKTKEWCFYTNERGRINKITVGGENAWTMKGHAFFTIEFSEQLKKYLSDAIKEESKKGAFWEDLFWGHIEEMEMYIKKYDTEVIEEFDSLEELRKFDFNYVNKSENKIIKQLSEKMECEEKELKKFIPITEKGSIKGFKFYFAEKEYEYDLIKGLL